MVASIPTSPAKETAKSNGSKDDKARMLSFVADDALWHYERRKLLLKRDPSLKKNFGTYPLSALFLLMVTMFRTWMVCQVAAYIGGLDSLVSQYWATLCYVFFIDQFFMHSGLTFSHEHSHNLILDSKLGVHLIDAILDWHSTSFGENLKYVFSHSRFHHPNLGDKEKDSELENKSISKHPWNRFLQFGHLFIPGLILFEIATKQPEGAKCKGTMEFKVPKSWSSRKYLCYLSSACACLFYYMNGALMIQLWALGMYVSPWSVWRKGQSIAEHITQCKNPAPTYTTPGWLNTVFFGTGYHDEHHTFPMLPWRYLGDLKEKHKDVFCYDQTTSYPMLWLQWACAGFPNYRDPALNDFTGKKWYTILVNNIPFIIKKEM